MPVIRFPRRPDGLRCACAIVLGMLTSAQALGELAENEVMLLYNSRNPESAAIAARYLQYHGFVIPCDLNISYITYNDGSDDDFVNNCGITNRYITPCKFKELFLDGPSPFLTCLEQNPQILAITTTRGLPAAISDTLSPTLGTQCDFPQPCGGLYASFEAALSRLGLGSLGEGPLDTAYDLVLNPYRVSAPYAEIQPFSEFLEGTCDPLDPDSLCPGDMFLVSRLDSDPVDKDYDGDGDTDNVDGVFRMLAGVSRHASANKYATSAIFDTSPSSPILGFDPDMYLGAAIALWNDQWCYYYEDTDQFIHGADDPNATPPDADFTRWPILAMQTWGRWHAGPDWYSDSGHYVGYYNAHRLGVFLSTESFNGWRIHDETPPYPGNQGQVLEWIAAGGGFTVGYLQEPFTSNLVAAHPLFKNFYVYGLSWGEAVTASQGNLGMFATPIGDPLVTIIAHNPDITGDRIVDQADLDIVTEQQGQQGPDLQGDIDNNGIVDQADLLLVREAFGRNSTTPPTEPFPNFGCGDMNGDGWVLPDDLDFYHAECWAVGGPEVPCPLLDCYSFCPCECDLNGDALINADDEAILVDNLGTYLFDLDGNGCFDGADFSAFLEYLDTCGYVCSDTDPECYDPHFDLNCDNCINPFDLSLILGHLGNPSCN